MKSRLWLVLSVFIFFTVIPMTAVTVLGEEPEIEIRTLYYSDGVTISTQYEFYWQDGVRIKHGLYRHWEYTGELTIEAVYKGGLKHGKYRTYYLDGVLSSAIDYVEGKINGMKREYYPDGNIESEAEYVDDMLNGKTTLWYENGNKRRESRYKDDILHGLYIEWNEIGIKTSQGGYQNNIPNGVFSEWSDTGEILSQTAYEDGVYHGWNITWFGGKISTEENYIHNDLVLIRNYLWNSVTGKLAFLNQEEHIDGITRSVVTQWWDNGNIGSVHREENYQKHGIQAYWNEDGTKQLEIGYDYNNEVLKKEWTWHNADQVNTEEIQEKKDGIWYGTYFSWYANGVQRSEFSTRGDLKWGAEKEWYENGQILLSRNYDENGLLSGTSAQWATNGTLTSEAHYEEGTLSGTYKEWDLEGRPLTDEIYEDGIYVLSKKWTYYDNGQTEDETVKEIREGMEYRTESHWTENGIKTYERNYRQDQLHGPTTKWSAADGSKTFTGEYEDGIPIGKHFDWDGLGGHGYIIYDGAKPYDRKFVYADGHSVAGPAYSLGDYDGCGSWTTCSADGDCYTTPPEEVIPCETDPEENRYTDGYQLLGKVFDQATGEPVASADIKAGPGGCYQAATDNKGEFSIAIDSPPDSIPMVCDKDGWYPYSAVLGASSQQTVNVNIPLKKIVVTQEPIPVILSVMPEYGYEYNGVFLTNISLENKHVIGVDWNGHEDGLGVPGEMRVLKNGAEERVDATENGVEFTVDMGMDFTGSVNPKGNSLTLIAVNTEGLESEPTILHPIVIPTPPWSASLGAFGDVVLEDGLFVYTLEHVWPEEPLEIEINEKTLGSLWTAWNLMPLVGGRNFGIPPSQATLEIEARTDGSGSVIVKGTTGFEAAGQEIEGMIGGRGNLQYEPEEGLLWKEADFLLGVEGTIKKDVGPVTLIPALEGAMDLRLVGGLVRWLNSVAVISGSITESTELEAQLISETGDIGFHSASGEIGASIGLGLTCNARILDVELTGGGDAGVFWQVPADPGYLEKIEVGLNAKMAFSTWVYEDEYSAAYTFNYPEESRAVPISRTAVQVDSPSGFSPISTDFLSHIPYSRFVAEGSARSFFSTAPDVNYDETMVVENVYPKSKPAIAHQDGRTFIAFVYYNPSRPVLQATDSYYTCHDGTAYSPPVKISEADTRAEFAPVVAFDGSGNVVAVWEQVKDTEFDGEIEDMAATMEIVYAVYHSDTGIWDAQVPLTDNAVVDHSPMLARGTGGELMLIWTHNDHNEILGVEDKPDSIYYAFWDGSAGTFSAPSAISHSFADILDMSAAYNGTEAILVAARDMDGDLSTGDDEEIVYFQYTNDQWTDLIRLTDDSVADIRPQAVCTGSGAFEIFWKKGSEIVRLSDLSTGAYSVVRTGSDALTFINFTVASDHQDNLMLLWQDIDKENIDLFYRVFDAENQSWSADLRLTNDPEIEKDFNGLFDADHTLHLVYDKMTRDADNPANHLYHLQHTLSRDLAVDDLSLAIEPEDPPPGLETTLTCKVRNTGDMALNAVPVAFYRGDTVEPGHLIGEAIVQPDRVEAGRQGEATLSWTVPEEGEYVVVAVVDPDNAITESDETNNKASFAAVVPDIKVVSLRAEQHPDGTVELMAAIKNTGAIPVADVSVGFGANNEALGSIIIPEILPGKIVDGVLSIPKGTGLDQRHSEIWVMADPDDLVDEKDEDNNRAFTDVYAYTDISPGSCRFSETPMGGVSSPVILTLTNADETDLVIDNLELSDTVNFSLDVNGGDRPIGTLPATIPPGQVKTVGVFFTPMGIGNFSENLLIQLTDQVGIETTVPLTGAGVSPVNTGILAGPEVVVFPTVLSGNTSAPIPIVINNTRGDDIAVEDINLLDTVNFTLDVTAGENPLEVNGLIPAGEFRTVAVLFHPQATADFNTAITLEWSDTDIPPKNISVSGSAVPSAANIIVQPEVVRFGHVLVGDSMSGFLAVSNGGDREIILSGISLSEPSSFSWDIGDKTLPLTILPGESLDVSVTFTPAASDPSNAEMTFQFDDPDISDINAALTGTGYSGSPPDISVSPVRIYFENTKVGRSGSATLTVTNVGGEDLEINGVAIENDASGDFSIEAETCTAQPMASYDTCDVHLAFSPENRQIKTADFSISSNDPYTPELNVVLSGMGTIVQPAGDFNCDGSADLADVITALQVMVNIEETGIASECSMIGGDVDSNNRINQADVIYLLQRIGEQ